MPEWDILFSAGQEKAFPQTTIRIVGCHRVKPGKGNK